MQHLLHRIFPCWCLFTGQHTQFHYAYHHQGCGMANRALLPSKKTRWVSDQQEFRQIQFPLQTLKFPEKMSQNPLNAWRNPGGLEHFLAAGRDLGIRPPGRLWWCSLQGPWSHEQPTTSRQGMAGPAGTTVDDSLWIEGNEITGNHGLYNP